MSRWTVPAVAIAAVLLARPLPARACGAYIASDPETLRINDALRFVIVRDGTRTSVSVENTYRGPLSEFAILFPVPVVLHAGDVQTLDHSVFDAIEQATSPRLTTYRRDPCDRDAGAGGVASVAAAPVTVQSAFVVGEYEVVVLSATEAAALETWLADHGYKLPPALTAQLAPYIASGSSFFVARVDPTKVTFVDGRAELSPLRFDYDGPEFSLPLRLSAVSSPGIQDVLVHVLAKARYQAANRPNAEVASTDHRLVEAEALAFERYHARQLEVMLQLEPGAVVTEYENVSPLDDAVMTAVGAGPSSTPWHLTRLHLRVDRDAPLDDLVLQQAPADRAGTVTPTYSFYPEKVAPCGGPSAPIAVPAAPAAPAAPEPAPRHASGCGCGATDPGGALALVLIVLGLQPRRRR
jgi:uncharacterized protein (TIGR03382 family)